MTNDKQVSHSIHYKTYYRECMSAYYCHGAHSREEQGHADEDVNSNNNI